MELKIINKQEEPLLARTKIVSSLNFEKSTPSANEVKSSIASMLKANENLIAIKKISAPFGLKKAGVLAYIYSNEKDMKLVEHKNKKEKAPAAKPKEAEKEIKPKESQEEAKPEDKKEQ